MKTPTLVEPVLKLAALAACASAWVASAALAWKAPVWGPRNELAHFDYIESVSRGALPRSGGLIAESTFQITIEGFEWKRPAGFDGSRESMGAEGRSYEAQQPPLYYALMAAPNLALRVGGAPPLLRVRLLRLCQIALVAGGALLAVALFRELSLLFGISALNGYLLAAWLALINGARFTTLGNDSLSLLLCNLVLWLDARAWRTGRAGFAALAGGAAGAAFLCKYTNGLIFLVHITMTFGAWREKRWPRLQFLGALFLPFVIALAWAAFSLARSGGAPDFLATQALFEGQTGSVRGGWRFLRILILDSLRLGHAGVAAPVSAPRYVIAMIALNGLLSAARFARERRPNWNAALFASSLFAALLLGVAAALNANYPGVWWSAFRHFGGYQAIWFTAIFSIPFPLSERWRLALRLAVGATLVFFAIQFAFRAIC